LATESIKVGSIGAIYEKEGITVLGGVDVGRGVDI